MIRARRGDRKPGDPESLGPGREDFKTASESGVPGWPAFAACASGGCGSVWRSVYGAQGDSVPEASLIATGLPSASVCWYFVAVTALLGHAWSMVATKLPAR